MKIEDVVLVLGSIAALLAVVPSFINIFKDSSRQSLVADLSILNALPPESSVHKSLLEHIDKKVKHLIENENLRTRNIPEAIGGFFFFAFNAYGSYYFTLKSGGWLVVAVFLGFLALAGIAGFSQGVKKTYRDDKGKIIEGKPK